MEKQTFKIPQGVDSIEVSQHDGKIVLEPEELKRGDVCVFWDNNEHDDAIIAAHEGVVKRATRRFTTGGLVYDNAVKFESMEQYEKIRRGEV